MIVIAALYAVTWIGGYFAHKQSLATYAQRLYREAQVFDAQQAELYKQEGEQPPRRITRDGGPITKIAWCFPVLPGVLLADSYYVVGPLYGRGGVSISFFYGFGCYEFGPIYGWIS